MSGARRVVTLRLYLAGDAPHSVAALGNLQRLTAELPARQCRIEIVDVLEHPDRALDDGVMLTPTLVRVSPSPMLRLVGDLRDPAILRRAIGLGPE